MAERRRALLEALAAAEHASWAHWMAYVFNSCPTLPDGSVVLPPDAVARWKRQVATPYADLSEQEKESDRDEVRKILPLIQAFAGAATYG